MMGPVAWKSIQGKSYVTDQVSTSNVNYIELAADIVSAYVANNSVRAGELPDLIGSVHLALLNVGSPAPAQTAERPAPAMPVKKSVTPDAIYSLEDGKPYKSLKRHITKLGMTPQQYREKWGLPKDYPMVAAAYAAKRSELAKNMGLGQKRKGAAPKAGRKKAAQATA
jgi:predicted transcriptional regulator